MNSFHLFTRDHIDHCFTRREGETKLGERVQVPDTNDLKAALEQSDAPFVLLGIPEDIGVRANYGVGGTQSLWPHALRALLNVQHTDKLDGEQLLVLGAFDLSDMMASSANKDVNQLREMVAEIDDLVYPVIESIVASGKTPIVIGGGHNNVYPLLKGCARARGHAINTINLDAHSDYRRPEGRHSGNGFRYAKLDNYLSRYAMIGLHENYNSNHVVSDIHSDKDLWCCFYEDIFLYGKFSYEDAISQALVHTSGLSTGIELDLDCIDRVLSSAATPSGLSAREARQYVYRAAGAADTAYLHLTEGASELVDGRQDPLTAKLTAYLIADFIRAKINY